MKKIAIILGVSALALGLGGCSDMNKQDIGVITGGAVGGLLGSQFGGGQGRIIAAVGGAVAGAVIGGLIGKSMDKTDKLETQQALEKTRTGQTSQWQNPDNGNSYKVTPTKTYYRDGHPCRTYTMLATIDGKPEKIQGRACRINGQWVEQK